MTDNIIQFKRKRFKKGIILSGSSNIQNENGQVAKEVTTNDLMYYALYWDQIVLTQLPGFETSSDLIEQFKSNGVIDFYRNAPPLQMNSSQFQYFALESLIACQSVKKQDKSCDWLIYNNVASNFNNLNSSDILEQHAIRIEISQCLPYPSTYVPVDVLLKFKETYLDELDQLHYAKYQLFEKISNIDSTDKRDLAQQYEVSAFDKALKEYQSAFAARFPYYNLKPIIADIKNNKPSLWDLGMAIGDLALSGPTLAGAYTVGKLAMDIFGTKQKIHEAKQNSPQFHYISSAIQKGIILQNVRE